MSNRLQDTMVRHAPPTHRGRSRAIPPDLQKAADTRGRRLNALDDAEIRYALTFLEEATTGAIRTSRIDAIVSALPRNGGDGE